MHDCTGLCARLGGNTTSRTVTARLPWCHTWYETKEQDLNTEGGGGVGGGAPVRHSNDVQAGGFSCVQRVQLDRWAGGRCWRLPAHIGLRQLLWQKSRQPLGVRAEGWHSSNHHRRACAHQRARPWPCGVRAAPCDLPHTPRASARGAVAFSWPHRAGT